MLALMTALPAAAANPLGSAFELADAGSGPLDWSCGVDVYPTANWGPEGGIDCLGQICFEFGRDHYDVTQFTTCEPKSKSIWETLQSQA